MREGGVRSERKGAVGLGGWVSWVLQVMQDLLRFYFKKMFYYTSYFKNIFLKNIFLCDFREEEIKH